MARPAPLFADERTAAALFCMKQKEFRALVDAGHLPRPKDLGGLERWDMEQLQAIARGDGAGGGSIEW